MVLIDKLPRQDRPLAQRMLDGELDRKKRLMRFSTTVGNAGRTESIGGNFPSHPVVRASLDILATLDKLAEGFGVIEQNAVIRHLLIVRFEDF